MIDLKEPLQKDLEILSHIRKSDLQIPILILSDKLHSVLTGQAFEMGCRDWIVKENNLWRLDIHLDSLKKQIERRKSFPKTFLERKKMDRPPKEEASNSDIFRYISHELRTPMHAILSYSEFGLKKKNLDMEKLHSFFDIINRSAKDLLDMMENFILLYQMKIDQTPLNRTPRNFVSLVYQMIDHLRPRAKDKNIPLIFKPEDPSIQMNVDKDKIIQVLHILLSNAIRLLSKNQEIHLLCRKKQSQIRDDLKIFISNRKNIHDPDDLLFFFERGDRKPAKISHRLDGYGLEFFVCKEIIDQHGGTIYVNNCKQGSISFGFSLPFSC